MTTYLARRILQAAVVVALVTLIVFGLLWLAPGGAGQKALAPGSASQDFAGQYLAWLGRVVQGDLGYSARLNQGVGAILAASVPRTVVLAGLATLIALAVAVPVGLVQAVRRSSGLDHLLRGLTLVFYGMPPFVLGSVLVLFLAVDAHWFGAEGPQAPGIVGVLTDVRDLTLPVLTLALVTIAIFARYMRSSALDSLGQEYVAAARARGAGQREVLLRHVLRNSLVPVVTLVGLSLPQIIGGALVVEVLFNIQGAGWQLWQAAQNHDVPVTLGFTLVIGAAAAIGSLLADIAHGLLDPRVRSVRP